MKVYTAHLREARPPILVREGWSWGGFFLGPLWLFAKWAWIPAVIEIAAMVCLFTLAPPVFWRPVMVGFALLNGLMGRDLVRWSLDRRGYTLAHIVAARDDDSALARLFAARGDLLESQQ